MEIKEIAELIEKQGSIELYKDENLSRKKTGYSLRVLLTIVHHDKNLLSEINEFTKGYINYWRTERNGVQLYQIEVHKLRNILDTLEACLPHLVVKKEQAEQMIRYCSSRLKHKSKPYTSEELKICEFFAKYQLVKSLKKEEIISLASSGKGLKEFEATVTVTDSKRVKLMADSKEEAEVMLSRASWEIGTLIGRSRTLSISDIEEVKDEGTS